MNQLEITQSYVTFQSQTRLVQLAQQVATSRSKTKPAILQAIQVGTQIRLGLEALNYSAFLTKAAIDEILYLLSDIASINAFPFAPTVNAAQIPEILLGLPGPIGPPGPVGPTGGGFPFLVSNVSTDQVIDSFPITLCGAAEWTYDVHDATNKRVERLVGCWLPDGSQVRDDGGVTLDPEIGNTSGISFYVNFVAGNIQLIAHVTSGTWTIAGSRIQIPVNGNGVILPSSLTDGTIWIGSPANTPAEWAVTGDISLSNVGVASINPGVIVNADINAAAAIDLTKLAALAPSLAAVTNGSGFLTTSITTATQIGFLSNVTSDVQFQLNSKLTVNLGVAATGDILYFNGIDWTNFARGSAGQVLSSTAGTIAWTTISGGTPAGADTQIQFNQVGAFGASAQLRYDYTLQQAYVPNFNITTTPLNDNALVQILVRDAGTGQIKFRTASTLVFSNTAAANELMKSNGTSAVPSGLFSTTLGNLILGTGVAGASRSITTEGTATDISLLLSSKGAGGAALATTNYGVVVNDNGNIAIGDRVFSNYIIFNGSTLSAAGGVDRDLSFVPLGNGNLSFFTNAGSFGGGAGVTFYKNAITNPSTAVAGGGVMFVKSTDGKPYWRTGSTEFSMTGGGGGTPAGANTQIQYNNAGAFGASSNFIFNNSTLKLDITADVTTFGGNFLINNTSASSIAFYALKVAGGGNWQAGTDGNGGGTGGNQYFIYDLNNPGDYNFTIQRGTGNVGILSSHPSHRLFVDQGSVSIASSLLAVPQLLLRGFAGGSGNYWGGIGFAMNDHTVGKWGAAILGVDTTGAFGAGLSFLVSTGAATPVPAEAIRILPNLAVGIGTPSPADRLHVKGGNMILDVDGITNSLFMKFQATNGHWQTGTDAAGNGTSGNQYYIFNNDDAIYRFTIQRGNGNVGIGTNTPGERLTVASGGRIQAVDLGGSGTRYVKVDNAGVFFASATLAANNLAPKVIASASAVLTLDANNVSYVFTGAALATWTLPAVAGNTDEMFFVKNRGTAVMTLQAAGIDNLFTTVVTPSIVLNPGDAFMLQNDGTYWIVM